MNKAWKITGAIIGIILVVVLLRGCVMTSYLIPSSGMENSLFQGERILVNKWSYGLRLPLMALWNYHRWADSLYKKRISLFSIIRLICQNLLFPARNIHQSMHRRTRRYLIDRLPVLRNSIRKKRSRPEVFIYLSTRKRKTAGFITYTIVHMQQPPDGTR